ncbi:hypothetical protein Dimus_023439 [Dionaea muscipula]
MKLHQLLIFESTQRPTNYGEKFLRILANRETRPSGKCISGMHIEALLAMEEPLDHNQNIASDKIKRWQIKVRRNPDLRQTDPQRSDDGHRSVKAKRMRSGGVCWRRRFDWRFGGGSRHRGGHRCRWGGRLPCRQMSGIDPLQVFRDLRSGDLRVGDLRSGDSRVGDLRAIDQRAETYRSEVWRLAAGDLKVGTLEVFKDRRVKTLKVFGDLRAGDLKVGTLEIFGDLRDLWVENLRARDLRVEALKVFGDLRSGDLRVGDLRARVKVGTLKVFEDPRSGDLRAGDLRVGTLEVFGDLRFGDLRAGTPEVYGDLRLGKSK